MSFQLVNSFDYWYYLYLQNYYFWYYCCLLGFKIMKIFFFQEFHLSQALDHHQILKLEEFYLLFNLNAFDQVLIMNQIFPIDLWFWIEVEVLRYDYDYQMLRIPLCKDHYNLILIRMGCCQFYSPLECYSQILFLKMLLKVSFANFCQ